MEDTFIPNIKHKVSRIGLGTWAIGGWMWGGTDEQNAIKAIHKALDKGINLIDTAPVYGFGLSEEIIGKAIKKYGNRENIVIATKAGVGWENKRIFRDCRKASILKEFDASLKRLQVDYIDIYQIHWPDPLTPIAEAAETLKSLLDKGKIHAIGVSNFSLDQIQEFKKFAPLHTLQDPFNLFEKEIERIVIPFCVRHKISTLGYGVLCRGLLTGKITKETQFEGDDIRKIDPKFRDPRLTQYLQCVDRLKDWAQEKYQKPLIALAARWALDKGISVSLWGARKPEQLDDIDSIWGWKLHHDDFNEIDQILAETITHPVGPEFMAPPSRKQSTPAIQI